MEDTTISIVGIITAAIIMFVVPLILVADSIDDISQLTVQIATSNFVDNVIKSGKITNDDYNNFISRINTTGNTYNVDIEIKILDYNTSQNYIVNPDDATSPQNIYYSIYTNQIEEKLADVYDENANNLGEIFFKEGDTISVIVKNKSLTISQSLKNIYYKIKGENLYIIAGTASGTIAINGAT